MRTKLPVRRPSVTTKVAYGDLAGKEMIFHLTFGFDFEGHIREVFCAQNQFLGTDIHGVITDGCILISIYLQTGGEPEKLVKSLGLNRGLDGSEGPPSSLLGAIARAVLSIQAEYQASPVIEIMK